MKLNEKTIDMIAKTAANAALEFWKKEEKKQEKEKHDRRLRNVKLLLKNYRSFAIHSEEIKQDIQDLNVLLELDELDTDEFAIESIRRSKIRTLAMVTFINKMLRVYKLLSEQSSNPEDLRSYQTIYDLYISDNKKTVKEIAACQNVDQRTVYRDVNRACETLSILIFGVDSIRF
ncbi:hypothetical protein [Heyndrickxia oleronia]|uniref:hypothetical protein n=1 Tax=Heyndrickxia oleronia TaxID=38875 RepID=UPI001B09E919|nr:hypothetical protein [Heyndrickxia oleronia]GIN37811.1 hypothetical protein J19TS1_07600 [Heyndrickxia oleronia]